MARKKHEPVEYVLTEQDLQTAVRMLGRRAGAELLELPLDRQTPIVAAYITSRNNSGYSSRVSVAPVGAGKRK